MSRFGLIILVALGGAACVKGELGAGSSPGGSTPGGNPSDPKNPSSPKVPEVMPPPPYEPLAPAVYAAKVKDVLTGLQLTEDELGQVTADAKNLRKLIDAWMGLPQFREKMFDFWKSAFQQTQLDPSDLDDQLRLNTVNVSRTDQTRMLRGVEESFTRTVQALVDEGRPFTETMTTTRFMLNVPLMVALSFMDSAPRDDLGRSVAAGYWIVNKFGGPKVFKFTQVTNIDPVTMMPMPIPYEQTIDPMSPNFLKFTFAQPDPMRYPPCMDAVEVTGTRGLERVFGAIFGSRDSCQGSPPAPSLFTDEDWNTWKMVEIRQPRAGEERTLFWDLPGLRTGKELVLATPRVGFMTTLAFLSNWPTNPSNNYRVTTNQALIVALGRSFDDRATTVQVSETSVDSLHVQPNTACFACHQVLDPMRDFFKQSYSITYFQQLSTDRKNPVPVEGVFNVDGMVVRGNGVATFARAMADHPHFASAWTQKLCHYANASDCREDDPAFIAVAKAFQDSKFDWKTLVRELFSSPLVTYASKTKTSETDGVVIGIARRETWCTRLSNRLGIKDVCNVTGDTGIAKSSANSARNLSLGIAGSSYSRADERPVMPHDPNLFFSSATEKLCMLLAGQLVVANTATTGRWKVSGKDPALDEFVKVVMGVPGTDERFPLLRGVLARHYDAAVAAKEQPIDALKSTFVLACSSPPAISLGL
jgi:hypothetical protein